MTIDPWYKVKVMNLYYGYVRADLLSHGTTITLTHDYAKWNGKLQSGTQNVNIRADAGTNYSIVATLPNGALVEVLGTKNSADSYVWYQVRTSGAAGYVRSDLVIHAGNTSGDAPYSELPWSGRAVAEQMIQVYKYPYTTGEDIQSVPMKTYFSISKKIFYSNGEIWYYVVAEDNVLDQNGAALSGYVKESWVKVFPKNHNCEVDNELHEYCLSDGPFFEECRNCGKHILFVKPARSMSNLYHINFSNGIQSALNASELDDSGTDRLIDIDDLVLVIQDLENAYALYCQSFGYTYYPDSMLKALGAAIRKGYYDGLKWQVVLPLQLLSTGFENYVNSQGGLLAAEYNKVITPTGKVYLKIVINGIEKGIVDWRHMIASSLGYLYALDAYAQNNNPIAPPSWFGWAGDLATFAKKIHFYEGTDKKTYAMGAFADSDTVCAGEFSYQDLLGDVDAIELATTFRNFRTTSPMHVLSDALYGYYHSCVSHRKQNLINDVMGNQTGSVTVSQLSAGLSEALHAPYYLEQWYEEIGLNLPIEISVLAILGTAALSDTEAVNIACNVMAKYIISETDDLFNVL